MNYDLIFLLEERSMKNVLEQLLPKIIPDEITYICIPHQGKQDLWKSIPKKIQAFQHSPDTRFIIVHDQDSNDCQKLKSELLEICQTARKDNNVMIRIVCHELESWFLGELAAVEKAYNMKPNSLSKQQSKKKYRNPDQLNSAKKELKGLVKEYYPGIHSKKIAPHLSLTDNTSHSFQVFIKGIKHLLEVSP
ncbi:DUF4276 family protein [Moorena sp. SIO4G3]|uniref:DUF4276 family protein n=1 Tax=Moorena sp. SIO4G3 TaxID=2607821 RepID=UPI00142B7B6F|nr:DUF4276 family protein [Moorena sp. SIO4G3]NEO76171.1 DUF4276 family protein [Moorena sp. SIO4G3]